MVILSAAKDLLVMQYQKRLKQILCEKSIQRGDFVLTSGKRSNYYLDARLTTLDAEGALCSGLSVLELLKTLKPYPKAIGGLTMGADPIVAVVAALSHQQGGPPVAGGSVERSERCQRDRALIIMPSSEAAF